MGNIGMNIYKCVFLTNKYEKSVLQNQKNYKTNLNAYT